MAINRYNRSNILGINRQYGTSRAILTIRQGIASGVIRYTTTVLQQGQRLDSLAGAIYGDATAGWILAAASDIGWGLQVPPETIIRVPNLDDVSELIG